jgi:hypothetical protein
MVKYSNENVLDEIDRSLFNNSNFTVLIDKKLVIWLSESMLIRDFTNDSKYKKESTFKALLHGLFAMNLHSIIGSITHYNKFNHQGYYTINYDEKNYILTMEWTVVMVT